MGALEKLDDLFAGIADELFPEDNTYSLQRSSETAYGDFEHGSHTSLPSFSNNDLELYFIQPPRIIPGRVSTRGYFTLEESGNYGSYEYMVVNAHGTYTKSVLEYFVDSTLVSVRVREYVQNMLGSLDFFLVNVQLNSGEPREGVSITKDYDTSQTSFEICISHRDLLTILREIDPEFL